MQFRDLNHKAFRLYVGKIHLKWKINIGGRVKNKKRSMKNQFFFKTLIFWCSFFYTTVSLVFFFFTPLFRWCSFFTPLLFFTLGGAIPLGVGTKDSIRVNPFRRSIRITQKRRSYQNLLEAPKT